MQTRQPVKVLIFPVNAFLGYRMYRQRHAMYTVIHSHPEVFAHDLLRITDVRERIYLVLVEFVEVELTSAD